MPSDPDASMPAPQPSACPGEFSRGRRDWQGQQISITAAVLLYKIIDGCRCLVSFAMPCPLTKPALIAPLDSYSPGAVRGATSCRFFDQEHLHTHVSPGEISTSTALLTGDPSTFPMARAANLQQANNAFEDCDCGVMEALQRRKNSCAL